MSAPMLACCVWELTLRCNLRCLHCGATAGSARPDELSTAEALRVADELAALPAGEVTLMGGELFLRSDWLAVAEALREGGVQVVIFTNGTLGLLDIPARWMVSLDGTREVNDKIRGKGVYDKVMKSLECDTPLKPAVHITITRQNQHNVEDFLEEMSKNKRIQMVGFSFCTPEKGEDEGDIFIPLPERDKILDDLLRLRKKYWPIMGFNKAIAHQFTSSSHSSIGVLRPSRMESAIPGMDRRWSVS